METIKINTQTIELGQFLKWAGIVGTGGEAKQLLAAEEVFVNGELEKRRGRKLSSGDTVTIGGQRYKLEARN